MRTLAEIELNINYCLKRMNEFFDLSANNPEDEYYEERYQHWKHEYFRELSERLAAMGTAIYASNPPRRRMSNNSLYKFERCDSITGTMEYSIDGINWFSCSSSSNPPDGTRGVDINGGYEYKNGVKVYDIPLRQTYTYETWKQTYDNSMQGFYDNSMQSFNRKCDCGAEKVHGQNCSEALHASWCTSVSK